MYCIHDEEKLKEFFKEHKIEPYRLSQLQNAIYKNFIDNFDYISTVSKDVRNLLKENFYFYSLTADKIVTSQNGQTTKILWKTHDEKFIESVIMRHLTGRNTLCVSSQAGCPMACSFCATGKLGLIRNLEVHEIIEQIYYAAKFLNSAWDSLRNVVYMGMWEPFLNYENVKKSIEIACSQKKMDLANRRVTVSTCWIIPGIKKFWDDFPQTSLAISLHAPNDDVRKKIMPVDNTYPVEDLMKSLDEYVEKTNKKVFYEYIMINGVNDHIKLADELGQLLKWRLAHVNFIPYNPGEWTGGTYMPTPKFIIQKFQSILEKYGIPSTIRATMGDDINAACWQLANKNK